MKAMIASQHFVIILTTTVDNEQNIFGVGANSEATCQERTRKKEEYGKDLGLRSRNIKDL